MNFEFATAGRIVCGPGSGRAAGPIIAEFGRRALVVTGSQPERVRWLLNSAAAERIEATVFSVPGEPTVELAQAGAAAARAAGCNVIVGCGGGSVLDTAKAVAALVTNLGDIFDYLEVIGHGRPLAAAPLPCIAIPTTAGTGSEVTRNAVLASPAHRLKVSLRSPGMLPRVAIVDPELALGLPRSVTASTGCDALVQLIEPFISSRANPLTDGLCREGLVRAARSLRRVCAAGTDLSAREDMAIASLFGGMALANAGLGAVHGLASPIGGRFEAPHGAVCGILLAPALEVNVRALQAAGRSVERFDEVAQILTGNPSAGASEGIAWIRDLIATLEIPRLSRYGVAEKNAQELGLAALGTSSMKANPIGLSGEQVAEIVRMAL
jgi:alcohol dehydrogenase class IV